MELSTKDFKLILNNLKSELKEKLKQTNMFDEKWLNKVINIKEQKTPEYNMKDLARMYVEMYGIEKVIENYIIKNSELNSLLLKYKNTQYKEGYVEYGEIYNKVCEKMSEVKLAFEILNYIFNNNIISEHYTHKINELNNELNPKQYKFDF